MVTVTVNPKFAIDAAKNVLRQLPYALNNALSRVATEAVAAGRKEVSIHFQVRKDFIRSRVKVLQYPRPNSLVAVVGIDPRVQGTPLLLGFFEEGEGGAKDPLHGDSIAVPVTAGPARQEFSQPVATSFRFKNLHLNKGKGRMKTFIKPGIGVFQRTGPRKQDTELVYLFMPSAQLKPRMNLKQVMLDVFAKRFKEIFSEEFQKEINARAARLGAKAGV